MNLRIVQWGFGIEPQSDADSERIRARARSTSTLRFSERVGENISIWAIGSLESSKRGSTTSLGSCRRGQQHRIYLFIRSTCNGDADVRDVRARVRLINGRVAKQACANSLIRFLKVSVNIRIIVRSVYARDPIKYIYYLLAWPSVSCCCCCCCCCYCCCCAPPTPPPSHDAYFTCNGCDSFTVSASTTRSY